METLIEDATFCYSVTCAHLLLSYKELSFKAVPVHGQSSSGLVAMYFQTTLKGCITFFYLSISLLYDRRFSCASCFYALMWSPNIQDRRKNI